MTDKNISALDPQSVWKHFAAICAIPHPSFHEKELVEHIIAFAKENGLRHKVDKTGNIVLSKPATKGMEDRKTVILQAHLDMVSEKAKGKKFDFNADSIEAYAEDGWVKADGTTLGSDNGMGVAIAMSILESKDIAHGPLQALFTVAEEVGMKGAFGLDGSLIEGDILINLDSEDEGALCVGCAGAMDFTATFKYFQDRNIYPNRKAVRIEVRGLEGGHSGHDIGTQRANANKLLFRFLYLGIKHFDLNLSCVGAGSDMRNAIPREATAIVCIPGKTKDDFLYGVEQYEKIIREEYKGIEGNISIKAYDCEIPEFAWDQRTMTQVIDAICACPNGIVKMSTVFEGLVETSSNIARVHSTGDEVVIKGLIRSSSITEKEALANDISSVFELAGAKIKFDNSYNGWRPNMNSEILKTMSDSYRGLFGKEPKVIAVHAGLETGIIGAAVQKMDLISCGPTIRSAHSPNERVDIGSVDRFWRLLCHTLGNIPAR